MGHGYFVSSGSNKNSIVLQFRYTALAQSGRASDSKSEGWGFDSLRPCVII